LVKKYIATEELPHGVPWCPSGAANCWKSASTKKLRRLCGIPTAQQLQGEVTRHGVSGSKGKSNEEISKPKNPLNKTNPLDITRHTGGGSKGDNARVPGRKRTAL